MRFAKPLGHSPSVSGFPLSMPPVDRSSLNRTPVVAFACAAAALLVLLGIALSGNNLRSPQDAASTLPSGPSSREDGAGPTSDPAESPLGADRMPPSLLAAGLALLAAVIAAVSLYHLASHTLAMRRAAADARREHAAEKQRLEQQASAAEQAHEEEICQLAIGLSHEIRNPLHAIRLNLHCFQRIHEVGAEFDRDEMEEMLEQSRREIERVERLMQDLVGFGTREAPSEAEVDVGAELQAAIDFITPELNRQNVELRAELPPDGAAVRIDPSRIRQAILNVLQHAAGVSEPDGRVMVTGAVRDQCVELAVADSGPALSKQDRDRLFAPYVAASGECPGLGLAVARRFVEEADGEISCDNGPDGGAVIRIRLPQHAPPGSRPSQPTRPSHPSADSADGGN